MRIINSDGTETIHDENSPLVIEEKAQQARSAGKVANAGRRDRIQNEILARASLASQINDLVRLSELMLAMINAGRPLERAEQTEVDEIRARQSAVKSIISANPPIPPAV